jgi:hypothetical protein
MVGLLRKRPPVFGVSAVAAVILLSACGQASQSAAPGTAESRSRSTGCPCTPTQRTRGPVRQTAKGSVGRGSPLRPSRP